MAAICDVDGEFHYPVINMVGQWPAVIEQETVAATGDSMSETCTVTSLNESDR